MRRLDIREILIPWERVVRYSGDFESRWREVAELLPHRRDFAFMVGDAIPLPGRVRHLAVAKLEHESSRQEIFVYAAVCDDGKVLFGHVSTSEGPRKTQLRVLEDFNVTQDFVVGLVFTSRHRLSASVADLWIVIRCGPKGPHGSNRAYHALAGVDADGDPFVRPVEDARFEKINSGWSSLRLKHVPKWTGEISRSLSPDFELSPFDFELPSPPGALCAAVAPDGLLALGFEQGAVRLVESGEEVELPESCRAIAWGKQERSQRALLCCSDNEVLYLYSHTEAAKLERVAEQKLADVITGIVWVDDKHALFADAMGRLCLVRIDLEAKELIPQFIRERSESGEGSLAARISRFAREVTGILNGAANVESQLQAVYAIQRISAEAVARELEKGQAIGAPTEEWSTIWNNAGLHDRLASALAPLLAALRKAPEQAARWLLPIYDKPRLQLQDAVDHQMRALGPVSAGASFVELLEYAKCSRADAWERYGGELTESEPLLRRVELGLERRDDAFLLADSIHFESKQLLHGGAALVSVDNELFALVAKDRLLCAHRVDERGAIDSVAAWTFDAEGRIRTITTCTAGGRTVLAMAISYTPVTVVRWGEIHADGYQPTSTSAKVDKKCTSIELHASGDKLVLFVSARGHPDSTLDHYYLDHEFKILKHARTSLPAAHVRTLTVLPGNRGWEVFACPRYGDPVLLAGVHDTSVQAKHFYTIDPRVLTSVLVRRVSDLLIYGAGQGGLIWCLRRCEGASGPSLLWTYALGAPVRRVAVFSEHPSRIGADPGSPDRLVAASLSGDVVVLDASNGTRLWKRRVPTSITDLVVGRLDADTSLLLLVGSDRLLTYITTNQEAAARRVQEDLDALSSVELKAIVRPPELATILCALHKQATIDAWTEALRRQASRVVRAGILRELIRRQNETRWRLFSENTSAASQALVEVLTARELNLLASFASRDAPLGLVRFAWHRVLELTRRAISENLRGDNGKHATAVAMLMLLRTWAARSGNPEERLLKRFGEVPKAMWRWHWISLEAARLTVGGLDEQKQSPRYRIQWLLTHLSELPLEIVTCLHYVFERQDAERYGLATLTRIVRALSEQENPDGQSLTKLSEAMAGLAPGGFSAVLRVLSDLEVYKRALLSARNGRSKNHDAADDAPKSVPDIFTVLSELHAAASSWQPRTKAARVLHRTVQAIVPVSASEVSQETPLKSKQEAVNAALARVRHARVQLDSVDKELLHDDCTWMSLATRLASRAIENARQLLESKRRKLLERVRARVEVTGRSVDPSGDVRISLRLVPEGNRTLNDVTINIRADGRCGLEKPGRNTYIREYREYPAAHSDFEVELFGHLVTPDQTHVEFVVRVEDSNTSFEESWKVPAPAPVKPTSKLPFTPTFARRLDAVFDGPAVTVFVHPERWNPRQYIEFCQTRHSAEVIALDEIFAMYGRGRRYDGHGLTLASLRTHAFGALRVLGKRAFVFHGDTLWSRLSRESPTLPRQLMVELEANSGEHSVVLVGPYTKLLPFIRQTSGRERLLMAHRLPGWNTRQRDSTELKQEWIEWIPTQETAEQKRRALAAAGWDLGRVVDGAARRQPRASSTHRVENRVRLEQELLSELKLLGPVPLAVLLIGSFTSVRPGDRLAVGDFLAKPIIHFGRPLVSRGRLSKKNVERIERALQHRKRVTRSGAMPKEVEVEGAPLVFPTSGSQLDALLRSIPSRRVERACAFLVELGLIDLTASGFRTRPPWRPLIRERTKHRKDASLPLLLELSSAQQVCSEFLDLSERRHQLSTSVLTTILPGFERPASVAKLSVAWQHARDEGERKRHRETLAEALSVTFVPLADQPTIWRCFDGDQHNRASPSAFIIDASGKTKIGEIEKQFETIRRYWHDFTKDDGRSLPFVLVLGAGARGLPRSQRKPWAVVTPEDVVGALPVCTTPWQAIVQAIRSQLPILTLSPYQTGGPLPARSPLFVGRVEELKFIENNIRTKSILIVGERQIGKTSLLNRVYADLREQDGLRPVWLDLQSAASTADAASLLAADGLLPDENTRRPFTATVKRLRQEEPGKLPVFLLNEIDRIAHGDPKAISELRSLHESGQARILAVGYTSIFDAQNLNSDFYNFFVGPHWNRRALYLSSLTHEAARDLLRLLEQPPLSFRWRTEEERRLGEELLISLTYCIPWAVQHLGESMVRWMDKQHRMVIELEDARAVAAQGEDVVWNYLHKIRFDKLGIEAEVLQLGVWLLLTCVARERYFRVPADESRAVVHDPQLAQRSLDESVSFSPAEVRQITLRAAKELLNVRERTLVKMWIERIELKDLLMRLSLSPLIVPLRGHSERFGFPLHLYPRELERKHSATDPGLDDLILRQTAEFIDALQKE